MAEVKRTTTTTTAAAAKAKRDIGFLFTKENYLWMVVGGVLIAIGFILMTGGKNADPNTFDPKVTYSFTRITLAPIVILLGFVVEIYAIFKKPSVRA
jgi:hypothetical protein